MRSPHGQDLCYIRSNGSSDIGLPDNAFRCTSSLDYTSRGIVLYMVITSIGSEKTYGIHGYLKYWKQCLHKVDQRESMLMDSCVWMETPCLSCDNTPSITYWHHSSLLLSIWFFKMCFSCKLWFCIQEVAFLDPLHRFFHQNFFDDQTENSTHLSVFSHNIVPLTRGGV